MASVFLSYDHEDSARAAPIASALEHQGHSVWWDRHIHGGAEYNSEIETAVERSDAVVVLWSANSVRSAWVRDEAAEGRDQGKLVPILIDGVKPPMGFRQYQTIDLTGWNGGKRVPRVPELLHAIEKVARITAVAPPEVAKPQPTKLHPIAPAGSSRISRRLLIAGGAAVSLTSAGIWWSTRDRDDPRFDSLLDQSREAMRNDTADEQTVRMLEQATVIRPRSAEAWGLLALLRSVFAQHSAPEDTPQAVDEAEKAARRALSLDPREPNGLLAMFELQGSTLDWITRDRKLREIIKLDPDNIVALREIMLLTQAAGFNRESWDWNERALALVPVSADLLGKRALKYWIAGRDAQADKVADHLRALYPNDLWVWFVRLQTYAFTDRARAAQALIESNPDLANRAPMAPLMRAALPALDQQSLAAIARAREACVAAAEKSVQLASQAVMIMCTLGDVDTAFDIANGALLSRGTIVSREHPGVATAADNAAWRISTQWMWTPPAAPMRPDPRFLPLCEGIGLVEYWRKRGVKPDYMRN